MSRLERTWAAIVSEAATDVVAAPLGRAPRPIDYAGVGFIAGWVTAARFAALHPRLSRILMAELDEHEPPDPQSLRAVDLLAASVDTPDGDR